MPPEAPDREWAKRVRAAAAYAGLGLAELANHLGMSDSTLRRHLAAKKRPHEQRALWQEVARITQLPEPFFTVDFARLPELVVDHPEPAEPNELFVAQVRQVLSGPDFRDALVAALVDLDPEALRRIADRVEQDPGSGAVDPLEQEARAASRQVTGAAADLLDTYAQDDAAAGDTRDSADASQEAPAARSARKRSGG